MTILAVPDDQNWFTRFRMGLWPHFTENVALPTDDHSLDQGRRPHGALADRQRSRVTTRPTVLVVGATGSIGRPAVVQSVRRGHRARALVRRAQRARARPAGAEAVLGDLTDAPTLNAAGVDGIVFTHGSAGGAMPAERVDYRAVRDVLRAIDGRQVRIALMTAIGVTKHDRPERDWKCRGERLVPAGLPSTVVRPGWFDVDAPDEQRLVMLQGDRRWAGDPSEGAVSRVQIAEVVVARLTSPAAADRTLQLVAETATPLTDLEPLFAALQPDAPGALDAVLDTANLPVADEPANVVRDLDDVRRRMAEVTS